MKNVRFIRNDTKRITLENFIEDGENFYIVLGKPAKLEQAMSFSSIGSLEYNSLTNGVIPKDIAPDKFATMTYANIACHIIETNLTDNTKLSYEERCSLVEELDKQCPDLIEYIESVIEKDIDKVNNNKNTIKIKK